jgi:hypothetical protein
MPHSRLQRPVTRRPLLAKLSMRSRWPRPGLTWIAGLALAALATQQGRAHANKPGEMAAVTTSTGVQKLVNKIRKELALTHDVTVELVAHNPLKASVEPIKGATGKHATGKAARTGRNAKNDTRSFRLSIERGFLEKLTADELRAVIAHELGHVWIYTHHPYLQTEQLANTIAMRVVARESIVKVYGKVWAEAGPAGSLPRFTDEPVAAGLGSARPQK